MVMFIKTAVVVDGHTFALNGECVSYRFHVDNSTGDLVSDHFGGNVTGSIPMETVPAINGCVGIPGRLRREFPDQGRGDFRAPAVRIRHLEGHAVSDLQYESHEVIRGKPALPGLPATFGTEDGDGHIHQNQRLHPRTPVSLSCR